MPTPHTFLGSQRQERPSLNNYRPGMRTEPNRDPAAHRDTGDEEWLRRAYRVRFGTDPNFDRPRTFNEKIQAYKLRYRLPLLSTLADKCAVRAYVQARVGGDHLIPSLGCYDSFADIPVASLPRRFVLKATHGSGWNIFCHDKAAFDWAAAQSQMDEWLATNFHMRFREWAYRDVRPRIIVEEMLLDQYGQLPPDFKFFCFDGQPRLVQVDFDRSRNHTRSFYDLQWKKLPFRLQYPDHEAPIEAPATLPAMLDVAGKLSQQLPFVRVDLYEIASTVRFGELTLYPEAGFGVFEPPIWDETMGEWFDASRMLAPPIQGEGALGGGAAPGDFIRVTTKRFGFPLQVRSETAGKYRDQGFEEMTALLIRQQAPALGAFIDVGANVGFYSVLVGGANPDCKILAFEPVPETCASLRQNLEDNRIAAEVYAAAVSDKSGRSGFEVSEQPGLSVLIANPEAGVAKKIDVDVITLDEYMERLPAAPILVKIDTEGNEINVLNGMRKLIQAHDDLRLIVELHPKCLESNGHSPRDLLTLLAELGFDVFVVCDPELRFYRYRPETPFDHYMGERTYRNLYCVPRAKSVELVVFSHSSQMGGSERSLLAMVSQLLQIFGTISTVYLPGHGPLADRLQELGASVVVGKFAWWCTVPGGRPVEALEPDLVRSFDWLCDAVDDLRRIDPDLILTNTLTVPWGTIAANLLNRPHIWRVSEFGELDHGLRFLIPFDEVCSLIAGSSNNIITCSAAVRGELFGSLRQGHAQTIYPHVEVPGDDQVASREAIFTRSSSFKLLTVGHTVESKGQEDAVLAAIDLIGHQHRDVELCVLGDGEGPYRRRLQQLVADAHLEDRIRLVGYRDNVFPYLSQADAVLVCSRREAFGRVTVESMLLSKAVVATNTAGTPEVVLDEETGLLYSPGDIAELVHQINRLIDEPALRAVLAQHAARRARSLFGGQESAGRWYEVFRAQKAKANAGHAALLQFSVKLALSVIAEGRHSIASLTSDVARQAGQLQDLSARLSEAHQAIGSLSLQLEDRENQLGDLRSSRSWRWGQALARIYRWFRPRRADRA
jgi:FkbM family methyltransferase